MSKVYPLKVVYYVNVKVEVTEGKTKKYKTTKEFQTTSSLKKLSKEDLNSQEVKDLTKRAINHFGLQAEKWNVKVTNIVHIKDLGLIELKRNTI